MNNIEQILLNNEDDGIKVVENPYHSLFVRKIESETTLKEAIIDGEIVTIGTQTEPHNEYTLFISDFMSSNNELHKIMYELRKATEMDTLECRIGSFGGSVYNEISLQNTFYEIFAGRVTTVLDSFGFSSGGNLFVSGDTRIIYDNSSILFHQFSFGTGGKAGEIESSINYELEHFNRFFKANIVDKEYITNTEWHEMKLGRDIYLDAVKMAKRGIATHIIVDNVKMDAEAYLKWCKYKGKKSVEEWGLMQLSKGDKDE